MFQITVSFAESVRVECLGQCHNISNKAGRGHLTLNRNLWNRAHFHLFTVVIDGAALFLFTSVYGLAQRE